MRLKVRVHCFPFAIFKQSTDNCRWFCWRAAPTATTEDLLESGIYVGDPTNQFCDRQDVEWKWQATGNILVFKQDEIGPENISNSEPSKQSVAKDFTPAILSAVVLGSYDDCWLTPRGNWKGPIQVMKKFEDLKLSILGERPSKVDCFDKDYTSVLSNVKWLMQQISVQDIKMKGSLTTSRSGNTECLKFRHVVSEVSKRLSHTNQMSAL